MTRRPDSSTRRGPSSPASPCRCQMPRGGSRRPGMNSSVTGPSEPASAGSPSRHRPRRRRAGARPGCRLRARPAVPGTRPTSPRAADVQDHGESASPGVTRGGGPGSWKCSGPMAVAPGVEGVPSGVETKPSRAVRENVSCGSVAHSRPSVVPRPARRARRRRPASERARRPEQADASGAGRGGREVHRVSSVGSRVGRSGGRGCPRDRRGSSSSCRRSPVPPPLSR